MSAPVIVNFREEFRTQLNEIFFETSSKKKFKDSKEQQAFLWKYVGFYLSHYAQYAWLSIQDGRVLGYVLGMARTIDADLYAIQPHLKAFEEHFQLYPAHLHVNCHSEAQGKGIGKALVQKFLGQLTAEKISGLHIMTGPTSGNKIFYQKLGFAFEVEKNSILLMGLKLHE